MKRIPRSLALLICLGLAGSFGSRLWGQTSYPMITKIEPAAITRGQTVEVTISGVQNLGGASEILFEGTGLSGTVVDAPVAADANKASGNRNRAASSVKARISATADAALGPRELRMVTPRGVSTVGMMVIVNDPSVVESDDKTNDSPATAQAVSVPSVICGSVAKSEDVDWYRIEVQAGQRLTFTVWGNRLQDKIHDLQTHLDPIVVLHEASGRELAANDNYHFADPMLSYEFKEAGPYLIEVRDTSYAGNANWTYVLHVTDGPVATSVFPMVVRPGEKAELSAQGANLDSKAGLTLDVPAETPPGVRLFPLPTGKGLSLPVPLAVSTLPVVREENDAPEDAGETTPLSLPVAMSGRLLAKNDVDGYKIEAMKGQIYNVEVVARRAGSSADPVLRVLDAKGKTLSEADDTFGKDPRLEWTAPSDGPFVLQVLDLHSRGGDTFGYVLKVEEAKPDFVLTCDPDKLNVGPGSRTPLFLKVQRQAGFKGPVRVVLEDLPAGVSASPHTISSEMTQGVIVVSATADAKQIARMIRVIGTAETPDGTIVHTATPKQEIYLPGGGRGLYDVATLPLAVTEPSDIRVEATPTEIELEPGKTATIQVTITRQNGFDQPVNLAVDLSHLNQVFASALPTGVKVKAEGSKTLIDAKGTTGTIVLEAKPDTQPCEKVPITVMGHVSINFVVKTAYCSAPILVSVKAK